MFIACPHCAFLVALMPSADGAPQRCPRCGEAVQDEPAPPLADENVTADVAASADEPSDAPAEPIATPAAEPPAATTPAATLPATPTPAPFTRASRKRNAPSFVHTRATAPSKPSGWKTYAALTALVLLLVLQLLLAQRSELAANARWRPLVANLCGVMQCEIPAWREPAAFNMLSRNVQPKPGAAGTLAVTASFRNDARWPQPWPTLLVSLSDIDGREVGLRAFHPREYRGEGKPGDLLEPGQSAAVRFDVLEPAAHIVAFSIEFR